MSIRIREFIVDEFKAAGALLSLEELARRRGQDENAVREAMRTSPLLSDFRGLTPDQAQNVIDFYGPGVVFSADLERAMSEFQASKRKLEDMDRRFGE
jgi:hypothetical protein